MLDRLPWVGVSLDKSAIGGVMLTDKDLDDRDVMTRVRATRLGRHTHAYLMYAADEPGLIAPVSAVITDLDLLLSRAPGYRYLCGASEAGRLAPQDLAESEDAVCLWLRT